MRKLARRPGLVIAAAAIGAATVGLGTSGAQAIQNAEFETSADFLVQ